MTSPPPARESQLIKTRIRDLGLTIAGTPLEPVIEQFQRELERAGIRRIHPHFYLSTEWGVPFDTISIAIPFYLARPDLTAVHAEQVGHLEGDGATELLRYLRHEMGHVVNYAYRLYDKEDWIKQFGSITQPYLDNYNPVPFSRKFVWHLPGWYAQKHPDEDWAETFAVWMTPGIDWRSAYADWPEALSKLTYCDQTMELINQHDPVVTTTEADDDVSELSDSLEEYYRTEPDAAELPPGLDGALKSIFEDFGVPEELSTQAPRLPAHELIVRFERNFVADVYRWTGHFPEPTRRLVQHLAARAEHLHQVYPKDHETHVAIALSALITSLAMNQVFTGSYVP